MPHCAGAAGVVATARENYNTKLNMYTMCNNIDNKIKQQIIDAIDPIYIKAFSDQLLGHSNVMTSEQLLTHIVNTHGEITQDDLKENA